VRCPPGDLIHDWDEAVEPMFAAATLLRRQTEDLVSIRDLLLPRLVTGQIDVSKLHLDALVDSVP
jgi:type I restriction enzyme S subunit